MKGWFKRHRKKTIVAINLLVLLLAVLFFEIYLSVTTDLHRVFSDRYIRLREHPPSTVIPDATLPDGSVLRTDEHGFILPSLEHEDPDLTIVFLGGSTTECLIVEEEKRFPYLAGKLLEHEGGFKINVINCSHRGNNTAHSINVLFNKIIPFKPQCVVMMHNINDLVALAYLGTYWNEHFTRSLIVDVDEGWLETVRLLSINTFPHIFEFLKKREILDIDALIHERADDEWKAYREKALTIDTQAIKKMFADNLRLFVALCRNFRITPVLMTQPSNGEEIDSVINNISIFTMHGEFNDVIRKVAAEEGIVLIDLAKDITNPKFFHDFVHFNNYGSSQVGKYIGYHLLAVIKP